MTPAWSSCPARRSRSAAAATISARRDRARPGARLIWGDIWLPGRYDRGALSERFQFDRIVQDLEVRREAGWCTATVSDGMDPGRPTKPSGTSAGPWRPPACSSPVPCRRPCPRPAPPPALGVPPRHRRELHPMVRPPGGRHGRPRPHRDATGRELDRRARGPSLAPRLERPRPQPLVFDAGGRTGGWEVEARVRSTIERRIDLDRRPNGHPNSGRALGGDSSEGELDVLEDPGRVSMLETDLHIFDEFHGTAGDPEPAARRLTMLRFCACDWRSVC